MRDLEKPREKSLEGDLDWICESFGFYEEIDREKTASKIFRELLNSATEAEGLTSTSLGEGSDVTRGAALNHLKRMIASGLVVKDGNKYSLRCSSLYRTINEVRRDVDRLFEDVEAVAADIDLEMGVRER